MTNKKTITVTQTTATTVTRVLAGTPGAFRLPVWTSGPVRRMPRIGETVDTYRDGSTLYAMGVLRW